MNKEVLRIESGMSSETLAKLVKNQIVSMDVFGRICEVSGCDVRDIVSYISEVK